MGNAQSGLVMEQQRVLLSALAKEEYNKLPESERGMYRSMWESMDADGDGTVTLDEAVSLFHVHMSTRSGPKEADRFAEVLRHSWGLIDADGDSRLDVHEFFALAILLGAAVACERCKCFVLDQVVWACPACWAQKLLPGAADEQQQGDCGLLPSVCMRCCAIGTSQQASCSRGHGMELVQNEWRTPHEQWDFTKGLPSRPTAVAAAAAAAAAAASSACGVAAVAPKQECCSHAVDVFDD